MAILKPDNTTNLGGVTVNEYLLTKHNPNHIDMPSASMEGKILGVTVHNTDWITTAAGTTPAEQYTRATVNGNMNDVRVHYYCDDICAWQNLPHEHSGWHAADDDGNGNRRTIAIKCIMSSDYNERDRKSEDNCARLAAELLRKYGLGIDNLYTHTHWLNVEAGRKGSVDELNTTKGPYKYCPAYILPHWAEFKARVAGYLGADKKPLFRVRKAWADVKSQTGAYAVLDNAKNACGAGYTVFDENGNAVYTNNTVKSYAKGTKIELKDVNLYVSSTEPSGIKKTGTFYLYDGMVVNSRMRITVKPEYCGDTPIGKYVTGWVNKDDI